MKIFVATPAAPGAYPAELGLEVVVGVMAVPHGLVQKDEEAAIAAAREGISNGSRSINDLPGSISFYAVLSL
jgi:hypothetical protein